MGKLALVTGASRGIGKAITYALARDGYDLVITSSHSPEALREIASDIGRNYMRNVIPAVCDMGDAAQVAQLFQNHKGMLSGLTLLVNNAGISEIGLLQDMSVETWDRIVRVNLSSCYYTARYAVPIFLAHAGKEEGTRNVTMFDDGTDDNAPGRIINISSVWGNVGASCEVAYSATKGGMNAFTKALGKELAPSGIPVNAIACGCVDTVMNDHLTEEDKAALAEEIPAGRFATPEEIASVVMRLVHSPAYLTGQVITVDGGWQ